MAQLGKDGFDNILSNGRLSISKWKKELTTHGDNDNNTTDATNDKVSKFDLNRRIEQVPQVQLKNMDEDGDVNPTKAAQSMVVEGIVDRIAVHNVMNGKTLYHVCWYGYSSKDNTAETADHLLDYFIIAYWRRRNPRKHAF